RVDALLHVTGYYNNPPQEGLLRHFRLMGDLAAENDASVILYNVPGRTKSNIEADTTIELSTHPAIVAIKEASGDLNQVQKILDQTDRNEFTVLSGEDHLVAEIIRRGGTGVISASANVWPHEFQCLCDLALAGEHEKAAELQKALMPCVEACFCVKNPIPIHYMLNTDIRLPLVRVEDLREPGRNAAIAKIKAALAICEFPHAGVHAGPKTV
ncbi:dihydrodipicolinate synthase family protein, partial [Candidatus Poribacteria bacterium]|nr:dihydrodipicolinate synthase family protein [Candidatus Poribacteria bacterium]